MKKVFSLVLAMLMFAALVPAASAAEIVGSGWCGADLTWTLDSDGTLTISGTGEMDDYYLEMDEETGEWHSSAPWNLYSEKILSAVIENGMTRIGDNAFDNAKNLKEIVLPESLTSIGSFAFDNAKSLTKVDLPESLTSIEHWAFVECGELTSVTIPESVTTLGNGAFAYSGLKDIYIPAAVTQIGDEVVSNCYNLTAINVDEANENYKSYDGALFDKSGEKLIACPGGRSGEFNVPEGVKKISDTAFYGCVSLTAINVGEANENYRSHDGVLFNKLGTVLITCPAGKSGEYSVPYGVKEIGKSAFEACEGLTEIKLPESVEVIDEYAFLGCRGITGIELPGSIDSIEYFAFGHCDSLTEMVIPEGVKKINWGAFSGCEKLLSVTVPVSVERIGVATDLDSFSGDVYYRGSREQWEKIVFDFEDKLRNVEVHYLSEAEPEVPEAETEAVLPEELEGDDSGWCGVDLAWKLDGGILTVSGTGEMTNYERGALPPWYFDRDKIRTIILCDGVTSVGESAFKDCVNLTRVDMPESVTSIGYMAFECCKKLKDVKLPKGVTSIEPGAFIGCASITKMDIPEGVTVLGWGMFTDCEKLAEVKLPESMTEIESSAFSGCVSLKDLKLPEGVTKIGSGAFDGTPYYNDEKNWENGALYMGNVLIETNSDEVNGEFAVKDGTIYIAGEAFYDCDGLSGVTIPDSVTGIGEKAFQNCDGLTEINIPESVTEIGYEAFAECGSLEEISIPKSVTEIGYQAFYRCLSLKKASILGEKTRIGSSAFDECEELNDIYISGAAGVGRDAFSYTAYYNDEKNWKNGVLYIGNVLVEAKDEEVSGVYTVKEGTSAIADNAFTYCAELKGAVIPEGVTEIGDLAFYDCESLESITIPKSVTYIGEDAFRNCYNLTAINVEEGCENYKSKEGVLFTKGFETLIKCPQRKEGKCAIPRGTVRISEEAFADCMTINEVIIPEGVTDIGDFAFSGCISLERVTIPKSVENIGEYAFNECESLESVVVPKKVKSLGDRTFGGCISLKDVKLNDGLKAIGYAAFAECGKLKSIVIPGSVKEIGYESFADCGSLESAVMQKGVERIISGAFSGCTSLKKVSLPEGVESIGTGVFSGCSSLTDIVIPESLTDIGGFAFAECVSLESIRLPKGSKYVGYQTFADCTSLKSVSLPEGLEIIAYGAFEECESLKDILIPGSVTGIGDHAFFGCESLTDIVIPGGVTEIGEEMFFGCENLKNISFPEGITFVGKDALYNTAYYNDEKNWDDGVLYICDVLVKAKGISGVYKIRDNVTCISPYAFEGCTDMTGVIIPESVTRIGEGAFYNTGYYNDEKNRSGDALYLGDVLIEAASDELQWHYCVKDGTRMIGDSAFEWTENLMKISIPESVKIIGESAFLYVNNLTDVYFGGTEEEWKELEERSGSFGLDTRTRVHYNSGIKDN